MRPPTTTVGSKPAARSTVATSDVVVVLPWLPAIATPYFIQWAPGLPKTRSGKIMRRILRKLAANDFGELGDTSTLADPSVVDDLVANRANR